MTHLIATIVNDPRAMGEESTLERDKTVVAYLKILAAQDAPQEFADTALRMLPLEHTDDAVLDVIELVADHLASGGTPELADELREKLVMQIGALDRVGLLEDLQQHVREAYKRVFAAVTRAALGEAGKAAALDRFDVLL